MEEYEELDMVNKENTNNANGAEGVDVDDMKKRLKEMEEEAAALNEMQAKVESHMVLQGQHLKEVCYGECLSPKRYVAAITSAKPSKSDLCIGSILEENDGWQKLIN